MRTTVRFLLLVMVLGLVGGGGLRADGPGLEGVDWKLIEVGGAGVELAGEGATMTLDAAEKRVTGLGGVNRFFGEYEMTGDALRFGPIGSTMMAGPEAESAVEAAFFAALAEVRRWSVVDERLKFRNETGGMVARFERVD